MIPRLVLVVLVFLLAPLAFDPEVGGLARVVPRRELTAHARTRPERAQGAIDDVGQTIWRGPCEVGEYLRVELDPPRAITAVTVDFGQNQDFVPRQVDVVLVKARGGHDIDAFAYAGTTFRLWQRYELASPREASAVVLRPFRDMARWSPSGRWSVRDVRIETAERPGLDGGAWKDALRAGLPPFALALGLAALLGARRDEH